MEEVLKQTQQSNLNLLMKTIWYGHKLWKSWPLFGIVLSLYI